MTRSASHAPPDLVNLKANRADTVIGPLKWDEKRRLRDLNLASSSARRRLVNRRVVMPVEDVIPPPARRAGLKRLPYVRAAFYFLQQMFNGVTLGSNYALIAIGYTMVYALSA